MKNKIGGIGLVFVDREEEDKSILSQSSKFEYDEVTNNQMELIAAITALQTYYSMRDMFLERGLVSKGVTVYSDSAYVVNGITSHVYKWDMKNGIKSDGGNIKNLSYWRQLYSLHMKTNKTIKFEHIMGHSGQKWNELSDSLAQIQAHGKEVNKR